MLSIRHVTSSFNGWTLLCVCVYIYNLHLIFQPELFRRIPLSLMNARPNQSNLLCVGPSSSTVYFINSKGN